LRVGGHLALSLHSSNEPGELSQWPRHDDSTINIVIGISIILLLLVHPRGVHLSVQCVKLTRLDNKLFYLLPNVLHILSQR